MPNLDGLEAALRIRALEAALSATQEAACSAQDTADSTNASKRRRRTAAASAMDSAISFPEEADGAMCSSFPPGAPTYPASASAIPNPATAGADGAPAEPPAAAAAAPPGSTAGPRPDFQRVVILAVTCSSDDELWARPVLRRRSPDLSHTGARWACVARGLGFRLQG